MKDWDDRIATRIDEIAPTWDISLFRRTYRSPASVHLKQARFWNRRWR